MSEEGGMMLASSSSGLHNRPRRVKLSEQQLESYSREELIRSWRDLDSYADVLESQISSQEAELTSLRESEDRLRQQHMESSHREKVLVRRLATKEQEMQEYANQMSELKASQAPGATALRAALLDPAVNLLLQRLRRELLATRARLDETQNELSAWKFTPDSNTGKRLMAKCRLLYQENEELGRMVSSGRLAKLEGDLALQKSFSEEVKKSQSELDEFLQDLDEDVEGMQSTIYYLQQELRKAKEAYATLQQENALLKSGGERTKLTDVKEEPAPGEDSAGAWDAGSPSVGEGEGTRPAREEGEYDRTSNTAIKKEPPDVEYRESETVAASTDSAQKNVEVGQEKFVERDSVEEETRNVVRSPLRKRTCPTDDSSDDSDDVPLIKKVRRDSEISLHYEDDDETTAANGDSAAAGAENDEK